MKLLPLYQLGPHELPGNKVRFGLFLPWVSAQSNNALSVKIIHEEDQFIQSIPPISFPLVHSMHPTYADFWSGEVTIDKADRPTAGSEWGKQGRYVYRFELKSPLLSEPLDWIIDPYAREYGIGRQSAFTLGYKDHKWGQIENTWKTPALQDLVAYEIMLHEFATDLKGAIARLPYLQDLGINCIEVMPVANVDRSVDWGFEPVGPFGPDERFGKRKDLQQFIEAAHECGIAVILDMIYGHSGRNFIYERVYNELHYHENPFMGSYAKDMFGPSTNYYLEFTRDFYFTVNYYWLDKYHVDGIRYDCVPNYYRGCMDEGYSNLVYNTYQKVKDTNGSGHWQRFFNNGNINLIQCAEQLENPVEIVEKTYSNCTWQNETLNAANAVATGQFGNLYDFAMRLGLEGYPEQATHVNEVMSKTALQFLENHDHPRFICHFGTVSLYKEVLREGKRENWYKLQPYIIGLFLGKGIPMLWEGQEIVENYDVPDSGPARIGTLRPVRWERFYDHAGKSMIGLFRRLISMRRNEAVFRYGNHYFYNDWDNHQWRGLILFSREYQNTWALVALNFSEYDHEVDFSFPYSGDYTELLHNYDNLMGINSGSNIKLQIPAHYGRVWIRK